MTKSVTVPSSAVTGCQQQRRAEGRVQDRLGGGDGTRVGVPDAGGLPLRDLGQRGQVGPLGVGEVGGARPDEGNGTHDADAGVDRKDGATVAGADQEPLVRGHAGEKQRGIGADDIGDHVGDPGGRALPIAADLRRPSVCSGQTDRTVGFDGEDGDR